MIPISIVCSSRHLPRRQWLAIPPASNCRSIAGIPKGRAAWRVPSPSTSAIPARNPAMTATWRTASDRLGGGQQVSRLLSRPRVCQAGVAGRLSGCGRHQRYVPKWGGFFSARALLDLCGPGPRDRVTLVSARVVGAYVQAVRLKAPAHGQTMILTPGAARHGSPKQSDYNVPITCPAFILSLSWPWHHLKE